MNSKILTLWRVVLLAAVLLTLFTGPAACKKAPKTTAPLTTTNAPITKTTASPLTVLSITGGDVFVMKPGEQEWKRAEAGMTLGVDYKIKTQAGGKAAVTFFEGSVIELDENTEITLANLGLVNTTANIKLKQAVGETISRVKKLSDAASTYEIETRAATMAVRGTIVFTAVSINETAFFGSIDGSFFVTAQGKQTVVPDGKHVNVNPGEPPGEPEPGATPTVMPTTVPPTTPPTTAPAPEISFNSGLNKSKIFNGNTVTINYSVGNTGKVPVSGVGIIDDKAGTPVYVNGDADSDTALDPGETWMYKADYTVPAGVSGVVTATAIVSFRDAQNRPYTKTVVTTIPVTSLAIQIISPNANTVVSASLRLVGAVNDPSVTEVKIDHNGAVITAPVSGGYFSADLAMAAGVNVITITAASPGGATATAKIELQPVENPK
jgi:hypothetical protein